MLTAHDAAVQPDGRRGRSITGRLQAGAHGRGLRGEAGWVLAGCWVQRARRAERGAARRGVGSLPAAAGPWAASAG